MTKRLIVLTLALAVVGTVWADDLNPPTWRGEEDTVFAEWDFPTSGDINPAPYSGPGLNDTYLWSEGPWTWYDTYAGRQGVWEINGDGGWDVANYEPSAGGKYIQVQITYYGDFPGMHSFAEDFIPQYVEETVSLTVDYTEDAGGGWTYALLTGQFQTFNPDMEAYFPYNPGEAPPAGGFYVDQIVIDTLHYTPEPATMALFALGGLIMIRRRK